MRPTLMAVVLGVGILVSSSAAKAATEIDLAYDYVETKKGTSHGYHGTEGFALYDNQIYTFNESRDEFHAPLNKVVHYLTPYGLPFDKIYSMSDNEVVDKEISSGHQITHYIKIKGDVCESKTIFSALPGRRYMLEPDDGQPFAVSVHNETCTIRHTDWMPPQEGAATTR